MDMQLESSPWNYLYTGLSLENRSLPSADNMILESRVRNAGLLIKYEHAMDSKTHQDACSVFADDRYQTGYWL